jgi:hypothetical protein
VGPTIRGRSLPVERRRTQGACIPCGPTQTPVRPPPVRPSAHAVIRVRSGWKAKSGALAGAFRFVGTAFGVGYSFRILGGYPATYNYRGCLWRPVVSDMVSAWVYFGVAALVIVTSLLFTLLLLRRRRPRATASSIALARPKVSTPPSSPRGATSPVVPVAAAGPAYLETPSDAEHVPHAVPVGRTEAAGRATAGEVARAREVPEEGDDLIKAELAVGGAGIGGQPVPRREPTPQLPRLSEEVSGWLVEEYRRLGPQLRPQYAALGPSGVVWHYYDLYRGREQEVVNLRTQVESLRRTALHQKVRGLEQTLRESAESTRKLAGTVTDQARLIGNLKTRAVAAEALVAVGARRIEKLSQDLGQVRGERDRDRQTVTELSTQLAGMREKIETMEGEARYRERLQRLFTDDEIAHRQAQLAILLTSA